jgi:hypothetical protein
MYLMAHDLRLAIPHDFLAMLAGILIFVYSRFDRLGRIATAAFHGPRSQKPSTVR